MFLLDDLNADEQGCDLETVKQNMSGLRILLTLLIGGGLLISSWPLAAKESKPKGKLVKVRFAQVRPTQRVISWLLVGAKTYRFRKLTEKNQQKRMRDEAPTAIKGPDGKYWVSDHHHELFSWHDAGIDEFYVLETEDFSDRTMEEFEERMTREDDPKVYLKDENGNKVFTMRDLPQSFTEKEDRELFINDDFRYLVHLLKMAKLIKKSAKAFADFEWSVALRQWGGIALDWWPFFNRAATEKAFEFARSEAAQDLPGYIRPKGSKSSKSSKTSKISKEKEGTLEPEGVQVAPCAEVFDGTL
ncbi:MAG: hypothetical protein C5B49_04000 [Bdellovibrio sp.]|nr:MAG: hypothetical protein C5B49_04000 [Bdellovibrio sp.]